MTGQDYLAEALPALSGANRVERAVAALEAVKRLSTSHPDRDEALALVEALNAAAALHPLLSALHARLLDGGRELLEDFGELLDVWIGCPARDAAGSVRGRSTAVDQFVVPAHEDSLAVAGGEPRNSSSGASTVGETPDGASAAPLAPSGYVELPQPLGTVGRVFVSTDFLISRGLLPPALGSAVDSAPAATGATASVGPAVHSGVAAPEHDVSGAATSPVTSPAGGAA